MLWGTPRGKYLDPSQLTGFECADYLESLRWPNTVLARAFADAN